MEGTTLLFPARPGGLEPPAYRLEVCCSIQLSYGREGEILPVTTAREEARPSRRTLQ